MEDYEKLNNIYKVINEWFYEQITDKEALASVKRIIEVK